MYALSTCIFPTKINHTFVVLILKKKNLKVVADFHSISLCNVLYKIIFKALANRLKIILPQIIFDTQCVFIPNRLIIDNVLIAYEAFHYLR